MPEDACGCGRSPDPGIRPGGGCYCADLPTCSHGYTLWPNESNVCPHCLSERESALRKALEFYAEEDRYCVDEDGVLARWVKVDQGVLEDGGEIARAALEATNG